MAARLREGLTHRGQRTLALSTRDDIHPGAKQTATRFVEMGGDSLATRFVSVAAADRGVTAPAHAGVHTHANADAAADVKHA